MLNKFFLCAAAFFVATGANAAVVDGLSDVTDNGGGSYTFVFDTVKKDIDGTGMGLRFTGGGIEIIASSDQGRVRQDYPANGGLGVLGRSGTDNLELGLGETLMLEFSRAVEIVNWTFNGRQGSDGHTDAADGRFDTVSDGVTRIDFDARGLDGISFDFVPDQFASVCEFGPEYCDTKSILFKAPTNGTPFKGYLESITVKVSPVPVPAALPLMLGALGGLGFAARRRRKA